MSEPQEFDVTITVTPRRSATDTPAFPFDPSERQGYAKFTVHRMVVASLGPDEFGRQFLEPTFRAAYNAVK